MRQVRGRGASGGLRRSVVLAAVLCTPAMAGDWPGWRGPHRDGRAADLQAPAAWPEAPAKLWSVPVGEGHASPVHGDGAIFVHAREGEEEVVRRIDPATGATVWRSAHPVAYSMHPAARPHGPGPKSTPVVAGGRLFTLSINGVLSCWKTADGSLVWRKDFAGRFPKTSPLFGTAASPLVTAGRLIAAVGGHDRGALLALEAATGKEIWAWTGDGPGYASPVVATLDGVRQVITQTQQQIIGVALDDGRLLWSRKLETPYVQNIVTPLVVGDMVVLAGLENPTFAVRPRQGDQGWTLEEVWSNSDLDMYMASPVAVGGRVCGLSPRDKGTFFCLEAANGKVAWRSAGRQTEQALALVADGLIWWLTSDAMLVVAPAAGNAFAPVARSTLADSPVWAHPAPLEGDLLVKDANHLTRWDLAPPARGEDSPSAGARPRGGVDAPEGGPEAP